MLSDRAVAIWITLIIVAGAVSDWLTEGGILGK